jgi:hypothetical protein
MEALTRPHAAPCRWGARLQRRSRAAARPPCAATPPQLPPAPPLPRARRRAAAAGPSGADAVVPSPTPSPAAPPPVLARRGALAAALLALAGLARPSPAAALDIEDVTISMGGKRASLASSFPSRFAARACCPAALPCGLIRAALAPRTLYRCTLR